MHFQGNSPTPPRIAGHELPHQKEDSTQEDLDHSELAVDFAKACPLASEVVLRIDGKVFVGRTENI
jgi:hypothetical protein